VVDPTTGETVELSEVDFDALSEEERANIREQLAEQGIRPLGRDQDRINISEIEVVHPTTGETVALVDIDRSTLSAGERRNIGDQLAEQGIRPGRPGPGGEGGVPEGDPDATAEAGDRGPGGEGRGGRGGRGGPRG